MAIAGAKVATEMSHPSEEAYFEAVLDGTPVDRSLLEDGEGVRRCILREARENVKRWVRDRGQVVAPAMDLVVGGPKPSRSSRHGSSTRTDGPPSGTSR